MSKLFKITSCLSLLSIIVCAKAIDINEPVPGRWSVEKINAWYEEQPWLVGCNYYPATAINQIEMWQASSWDPETIDKELELAASIDMNTLRVYLYDLVWADDKSGLYARMDEFLSICQKHGIRPWFVFFDDCHFPTAKLGVQPLPVKQFHNSGWLNCPTRDVATRYAEDKATAKEKARLKGYVQETMRRFADDPRVLMWELYNEPGRGTHPDKTDGNGKKLIFGEASNQLVYDSWVWAREVNPSQPVTSTTAGSIGERNIKINRLNSDIHSIHSYQEPDKMKEIILDYKKDGRPVIMSEWLARTRSSTVEGCLPVLKEMNVGAVNWGFVSGKSGTIWPWSSRSTPEGDQIDVAEQRAIGNVVRPGEKFPEPEVWFHDLFRTDGTPFDENEIKIFKRLTGVD